MNDAILVIDGEVIPVRPDTQHEYVLETAQVAKGYGVSPEAIIKQKNRHLEELAEGKHWVRTVCPDQRGAAQSTITWTKRGIIRLGFFIRSERAKRFRDAAEDLIVNAIAAERRNVSDLAELFELAAMAVRSGQNLQTIWNLIAPRMAYGAISRTNGKPRTRLSPAYFTSRWGTDSGTRAYLAADNRQMLMQDILSEVTEYITARLA